MTAMREIKFRGYDEHYKIWVYGDLKLNEAGSQAIITPRKDGYLVPCSVDIATVGQFTGLKDITDIDIYEGDIVDFFHEWHGINGEYCSKEMRGVVACDGASFDVITLDDHGDESFWELYTLWQGGSVQVIGNVHDDPGLLKEGGGNNDR